MFFRRECSDVAVDELSSYSNFKTSRYYARNADTMQITKTKVGRTHLAPIIQNR
jgi:hypothetical protein